MMQWSLFLLILAGQCFFSMCQPYEYHFISEPKTWYEAQTYCREKYTDLATVPNVGHMERLQQSEQRYGAWIGLHRECQWPKLNDMEQTFCENEAKKQCVTTDSLDNIRDCAERLKFICYCAKTTKNKLRLINKEKKWRDAQSHCRKKYTDLVSRPEHIQDPEFKKLIETVNEPVWISQFRPWRWSDGSDYSYRNWKRDPKQDGKYCSFMSRESGKWKTGDCMEKKRFFCYYDKLVLIREEKTWEAALEYCRANHKDLVSITKRDEQRLVQQTAQTADTPYVWLGLRYSCPLVMWFWVSDRLVWYENWASAEHTDEQCDVAVAMNKDGQWVKRKDSEKGYFVCSSW